MCRIWESLIYNIFELKRRVLGEKEHPAPYYMTLLLYNKSLDKVVSKVTVWKNKKGSDSECSLEGNLVEFLHRYS